MVKLLHSGDLGDIIAALPILKQLGGGNIILTDAPPNARGPRATMKGRRFDVLSPLLRAQLYVHEVTWMDEPEGITHDLTTFRVHRWLKGETLTDWQARTLGLSPDDYSGGWLTVPKVESNGHVVMARSPRYHNYFFPWDQLVRNYPTAIFVGFEDEYNALRLATQWKPLKWHPTYDLLELAELIAGAKLTICNQSAPFWIAAGLGVPLIQETYEQHPNSIIKRDNAIYTLTGAESRSLIYRIFPPTLRKAVAAD